MLLSIISSALITFLFLPLHILFLPEFDVFNYLVFLPPMIGTFILAQCGSLIRGFENWVDNIKLKAELETRNLKNELELLKSQINPHFLFNTLNNIDALIHKSPDDASRSLLSLSDMLRYMIYETNVENVSLNKEIEYLEHYIKLQKLRLRETEFVNYTFLQNCKDTEIAPVLFLPFVEMHLSMLQMKVNYPL
ncbi:MAG: histidine kinase [Chloroflexia bacterium]|nr:histidine kinase [Chloroflexia bacterium]